MCIVPFQNLHQPHIEKFETDSMICHSLEQKKTLGDGVCSSIVLNPHIIVMHVYKTTETLSLILSVSWISAFTAF